MPNIESSCRFQKAVWWAMTGTAYDNYGEPLVSDPVEIDVRWENVRKDILDPQGNTVEVDAVVVVDRDMSVGDILWLGTLYDLPGTSETPTLDIREVVSFSSIPDLKGRYYRRVVMLKRLSDELPT